MSTIPTPLPVLLRRIRYRVLPVFTLAVSCLLALWLWNKQGSASLAVGEVSIVRMNANAPTDGVLVDMPRDFVVSDSVGKGEVVARIDGRPLVIQMARIQQELVALRSDRDAIVRRANGSTKAPDTRPVTTPPGDSLENDDVDLTNANLAPEFVGQLSVLRLQISERVGRLAELQARLDRLEVRSPVDGVVVEVHRRPGQTVTAGAAVLTIAARQGEHIVSFIRQSQPVIPRVGMAAQIRPRTGGPGIKSYVTHVGPQIEKIPDTQLRDTRVPEWGVPVHVALPAALSVRPGELLDVSLARGQTMLVQAYARKDLPEKSTRPGARVRVEAPNGTSGARVVDVGATSQSSDPKGLSLIIVLDDPAANLILEPGQAVDVVLDGNAKVKGVGL